MSLNVLLPPGLKKAFTLPKRPKPQQQPNQPDQSTATPTIDQAAQLAEDDMRLRRRRGRASYMLSKPQQMQGQPTVGQKTLTGQ
jgi:hypothetical protein